jgi:hypothetical protein
VNEPVLDFDIGREERLILALLRSVLRAPPDVRTQTSPGTDEVDWDRLVLVAKLHGVLPLVHHALVEIEEGRVPTDGLRAVREGAEQAIRRSLGLTASLLQLLDLLSQSGIEVVPWKGPVLSQALWSDVGIRQYVDLDLLVRRGEVERAGEVLLGSGFRYLVPVPRGQEANYVDRNGELEFVRNADGLTVEVHWAILPSYYASAMDPNGLWDRLETVQLAHRTVPSLAAEDLLIALSIHGFKHKFERLEWVIDIARLLDVRPDLDWEAVRERTREAGSQRIVRVAVGLARRLFGPGVAGAAVDPLGADPAAAAIVEELARGLLSHVPDGRSAHISTMDARGRERRRDRATYFFRAATRPSPADWALMSLPRPLSIAYVAIRPLRLLGRLLGRGQGR